MNSTIVEWLEKISQDYALDTSKSNFQRTAINKAIISIKNHEKEIKSKKDALKIKGVGKGIADKIEIILKTGEFPLKHLNQEKVDKEESPLISLKKITGIGDAKAKILIEKGITNIDLLREAIDSNKIKVTDHIRIGAKYYNDFNERIPRSEIIEFNKYFKEIFKDLNIIYEICGSFRREKDTCGDIDILVTSEDFINDDFISKSEIMQRIIKKLIASKILLKDGTLTPDAIKKFMGTCKLPIKNAFARRLDIRIIKFKSYPTALMYFTGSKDFNLKMRNKAISMDMMLNEYGLYDKNKEQLQINSEEDIFKTLNESYIEPNKR